MTRIKFNYFRTNLSQWLYASNWHYTTLLSTLINTTNHLPDNADHLVVQLLQKYPQKPKLEDIQKFLRHNKLFFDWFRDLNNAPKIEHTYLAPITSSSRINSQLPLLHTTGDLTDWLGITQSELHWLAEPWLKNKNTSPHLNNYYYKLYPKRNGNQRLVEAPKERLKEIQRKINKLILPHMKVHNAAHGYQPDRSNRTHAELHTDRYYVISFDLHDFFQNIHYLKISNLFKELGYTGKVTKYLTSLCTHQCRTGNNPAFNYLDQKQRHMLQQRHLPQGAPTSPALSNAALYHLDKRLAGLAKSLGLSYSRYADDLTFSGNTKRNWEHFESLIGSICLEENFQLNHRKTKILHPHQKQRVTGIIVNQKPNICRKEYDTLKAILTNCVRHGLESQNRNNHPDFQAHLYGRVQYVKSINLTRGTQLENLLEKAIMLETDS